MISELKATLSRFSFNLNRNPRVMKPKDGEMSQYIPNPYKAVFILSADFELAWGWRYSKIFQRPKEEAMRLARISRRNIPKILELCDRYDVPITWATVGHLFLGSCTKDGDKAHISLKRIDYHDNRYWKFDDGDWFDDDPCTDWKRSPEWYGHDLIKMILDSKTNHEIGCHTFSHIDCRDGVCSPEVLKDEVLVCRNLAGEYGIRLESFVHPGHTIGNLNTIKELGFKSFRTDYLNILGYPVHHSNGLWEFRGTAELKFRKGWSVEYHIFRYKKIIQRALRHNCLCYFWFHPSQHPTLVDRVMPEFFKFIDSKRNIIWLTTAKDYVNWLESDEGV